MREADAVVRQALPLAGVDLSVALVHREFPIGIDDQALSGRPAPRAYDARRETLRARAAQILPPIVFPEDAFAVVAEADGVDEAAALIGETETAVGLFLPFAGVNLPVALVHDQGAVLPGLDRLACGPVPAADDGASRLPIRAGVFALGVRSFLLVRPGLRLMRVPAAVALAAARVGAGHRGGIARK